MAVGALSPTHICGYTLEASAASFSTQKFPVHTDGRTDRDIRLALSVGTESTQVTVRDLAALLETSTANLGRAITVPQVNDSPLNRRNFMQLLQLTPGIATARTRVTEIAAI